MKPGVGFPVAVFPEYADPSSSVYDRTVKTYAQLFDGKPNSYTFDTSFAPGDINDQREKTRSLFLTGDFSTAVFGYELDGTAGVRAVRTDQTSIGFIQESTGARQATLKNSYSNILPSLNTRLHVNDDLQLRFGYSKTMTRPNFSDMAAVSYTHLTLPTILLV